MTEIPRKGAAIADGSVPDTATVEQYLSIERRHSHLTQEVAA